MKPTSSNEIHSSREINGSVALLYEAFANPLYLKNWWGPNSFTNTFHEFDLQAGGNWCLTMHGPEKGNYENSSVFKEVIPQKLVSWTRRSQPLFDMEIGFDFINENTSKISFRMIFKTPEECNKMKPFILPNNEENFDRLEKVLQSMFI